MLLALSDTVRVVSYPGGGDITVYPAATESTPVQQPRIKDDYLALVDRAGLKLFRFDADMDRRRLIIRSLFEHMKGPEPFRLVDVFEKVIEVLEGWQISTTVLAKYQFVLWQARVFQFIGDQRNLPTRERRMRLIPEVATADDLIYQYEASIAYKVKDAARELSIPISTELLAEILGLEKSEMNLAYCETLLEYRQRGESFWIKVGAVFWDSQDSSTALEASTGHLAGPAPNIHGPGWECGYCYHC